MKRLFKIVFTLSFVTGFAFYTQVAMSAELSRRLIPQENESKAMREYKGVKLGMKREQVRAVFGKIENSGDDSDEFKLTGDDTLTARYENGEVKAIQLVFLDVKNAPAWADVVGNAEVSQSDSGAKHARKVVSNEHFWVTIWQNKDQSITRITISKQ